MKRIAILILALSVCMTSVSAAQTEEKEKEKATKKTQTEFTLGDRVIHMDDDGDRISISLGNKGIRFREDATFEWYDRRQEEWEDDDRPRYRRRFEPHWDGFGMGFNGYITSDNSFSMPSEYQYMDLNTSRSWSVHIHFGEIGIGFGTDKLGLVSGLGLEFNNYFFDGNNSITTDENGVVQPLYPAEDLSKSKLAAVFLQIPLLLEAQIPVRYDRLHIAGGIIGGVKIGSHTKMKYDTDNRQKIKDKGDFSLSSLRYGATARVGYESITVFANYSLVSMFEENKGPELYPFTVGLQLTFD